MRNFSWNLTVCAAIRCTWKVATPLPIRIATHDARAGMGLGDAVFAGRVPRNQSRDGMAFCGCARTAKKEKKEGRRKKMILLYVECCWSSWCVSTGLVF